MSRRVLLAVVVAIAALMLFQQYTATDGPQAPAPSPTTAATTSADEWSAGLPPEAIDTIELIQGDGPYPYRKDGAVFMNRERRLPSHEHGYWREYTVPTPGESDRGARRIVHGEGDEFYYTDDHYGSFRLIDVPSLVSR